VREGEKELVNIKRRKFVLSIWKQRIRLSILAAILVLATIGGYSLQNMLISPASLPVGSYWSGNGTIHWGFKGTGTYAIENGEKVQKYLTKFTIVNHAANTITISVEPGAFYFPQKIDYVIDLASRNITGYESPIPHKIDSPYAWITVDPQRLRQGERVWAVLVSDNSIRPFQVGNPQCLNINGANVEVWSILYDGPSSGICPTCFPGAASWNVTATSLYDKTYGILLGWAVSGSFNSADLGYGSRTWNYSETFQTLFTNIDFTQRSNFSMLLYVLMGGIAVTVLAAIVMTRRRITTGQRLVT